MKILVVDDHALVRSGLVEMLQPIVDDFELLETVSCQGALDLCSQNPDLDLLLLDLSLPDGSAQDILTELITILPMTPIVVLSAWESRRQIESALQAGVQGYIPKSFSQVQMQNAIRVVLNGDIYIPPVLMGRGGARNGGKELTERQTEVLELLATGKPNKEIARILDVSANTIGVHIAAIYRAFGTRNRTETVFQAIRSGVISARQNEG